MALPERATLKRIAASTSILLLVTIVLFSLVEGLVSLALSGWEVAVPDDIVRHAQYDSLLGWSNIPGALVADAYGPGSTVQINSQGFRSTTTFDAQVSEGGVRAICSGDSFTFGQGVANTETWCHLLSEMRDGLEAVNMGQPGYGVDQAYMAYMRDGLPLDHQVHLFAFISADIQRVLGDHHHGFGKPTLVSQGGRLVAGNVPVPRLRFSFSRVMERAASGLRLLEFKNRALLKLRSLSEAPPSRREESIGQARPIATEVFRTLHRVGEERDVVTVFVYLPTALDASGTNPWREMVLAALEELAVDFIDLTPDLRQMPIERASRLFIGGDGHYTAEGNRWVADVLIDRLPKLPSLAHLLRPVAVEAR